MAKLKLLPVLIASLVGLSQPLGSLASSRDFKNDDFSSSRWIDEDEVAEGFQTAIIVAVSIVAIILITCILLCFCCPICIIAKMRQRRGVVIRTAGGTTTATPGQTVTVTLNRSAPPSTSTSPPVIAIPNNYNSRNKPYPVQESVTVVPLIQPQQQIPYPLQPQPMNFPTPMPQAYPQNFELPPPYPGLPREADNNGTANLPYNPYFASESGGPTAPPK